MRCLFFSNEIIPYFGFFYIYNIIHAFALQKNVYKFKYVTACINLCKHMQLSSVVYVVSPRISVTDM